MDINDLDKNLIIMKKNSRINFKLGKPSNIVEKILKVKMKKYFDEVNQSYILDQMRRFRYN